MSAELPKMPPIDQSRMLPYSAIRYVPGYPEQYVQEYAKAYAQEAARQAMERLEPLRHAGAMLSNCAFNLAQRNPGQFTARDIEALDSLRKAWDEALRALIPQSEKRHG